MDTPNPSPSPHTKTIDPLLAVMASIPELWQASGDVFEPNHQHQIYRMNKTELTVLIDVILEQSIVAYEITDLKLEEGDNGAICHINCCLEQALQALRRARRSGRILMEEYNDDLSKKPEYMKQDENEDEDEDEDED
jgi:hypothetical protein